MKVDVLDQPTLKRLLEPTDEPAVSILLPTHRTGKETRQDPIRFGNLLKSAKEKFVERAGEDNARQVFAPADRLPTEVANDFWRKGSDGLALYLQREQSYCFKLPIEMPEVSLVSDHFYTAPLLSYLQGDSKFFVLAVSQNGVRLFGGAKHSIDEIELDRLPDDMRSALNIDEYVSSLQYHTQSPGRRDAQALFHGHGGGEGEDRKQEILAYFQFLDRALQPFLNRERAPLVFAGVEYLFPIFLQACGYSRLMDRPIVGSAEAMSANEMHAEAWKIVEPVLSAERREKVDSFGVMAAAGKATEDFNQIVEAARDARIDTLLIDEVVAQDPAVIEQLLGDSGRNSMARDEFLSLLAKTIAETIRTDGDVYLLDSADLPTARPVSALLRY